MAMQPIDTTPVDASEILKCVACRKGVAHGNSLFFYELTIVTCVLDQRNIQRMNGLEQMMGSVPLARIFSPDNTVAHRAVKPERQWLCYECAMQPIHPMIMLERVT